MKSLPRVRTGLLRHALDGQVLVYDPRDDRVHLLDPTTACVLELLEEGGWTAETITPELARRLDVTANAGLLLLALDQLQIADLLDKNAATPTPLVDVTRRDLVRKLALTGAAALLIPAVATLTSSRAYAQSGGSINRANGAACDHSFQCLNGCCGSNSSGGCNNNVCQSTTTCSNCSA